MKSTDPAARMGVFKRLEDVPPERRLHQHAARYTGRDSWTSFLEDVHFDRVTADRGRRDAERTGEQWKSHMAHQDRHHALALPEDVNAYCSDLLDRVKPLTAYQSYWVHLEAFFTWLQHRTDHPHTYHPVLMAAREAGSSARRIWDTKMERRDD